MQETPDSTAHTTQVAGDAPDCSFRLHHIRTSEALARFGGDEGRLRHWLLDFRTYGAQAAADIEQAIASGTTTKAISATHAFKGRAGMLGMAELHSIAQSLELTLTNGEPSGFWLEELTRTLAETQAEISALVATD